MVIDIRKATNSILAFTVGTSFYTATEGAKIDNPEGQKITITHPYALFMSFGNSGSLGDI